MRVHVHMCVISVNCSEQESFASISTLWAETGAEWIIQQLFRGRGDTSSAVPQERGKDPALVMHTHDTHPAQGMPSVQFGATGPEILK